LLSECGYDGVTMRDLAKGSGVALKTLYNVYGSKDEVLIASVQDRVAQVFERSFATAGRKRGVSLLLHFVESGGTATIATPTLSKAIAPFVAGPVDRFGFRPIYYRCHKRALDEIALDGDLHPWVTAEEVLDAVFTALTGVLLVWAKEQIGMKYLNLYNRLAVCQVLALMTRDKTLQQVMAIAKTAHKEIYGNPRLGAMPTSFMFQRNAGGNANTSAA
jgi:AcrR family transcriptional regulator